MLLKAQKPQVSGVLQTHDHDARLASTASSSGFIHVLTAVNTQQQGANCTHGQAWSRISQ